AAALIMIVVAGAFGFSDIVMMKYIAFGMIAALFLDATIIRMLLVPAVMKLLGDDCWWAPRWVKRLSARLGHGSAAPSPVGRVPAMAGAPLDAAHRTSVEPRRSADAEPGSSHATTGAATAATTAAATAAATTGARDEAPETSPSVPAVPD